MPRGHFLIGVFLCLAVLPFHFEKGELQHSRAHAFMGKFAINAVKVEAGLFLKGWVKMVAKKEGKSVALAALRSLKALPSDSKFRLAVLAALAGGNYALAAEITGNKATQVAVDAADEQWDNDVQALKDNPNLAYQSLVGHTGTHVEERLEDQWNPLDDTLTCGANNKDFEFKTIEDKTSFIIKDEPNDSLLEGQALLQRLFFEGMMRNATFENQADAQNKAHLFSRLACTVGSSRKVTSFLGGMSLKGKDTLDAVVDVRGKSEEWLGKMELWAEEKI